MYSWETLLDQLTGYPAVVKRAIMAADGDERLVDVLGIVTDGERLVREQKRMALSELEDHVDGKRYLMKRPGSWSRTYNFSSLLSKLMDATSLPLLDLLLLLRNQDVIRITFQWSKLQRFAAQHNVALVIDSGEVTEGDASDVGQVWKVGSPKFDLINIEDAI
jgi:hypothetical protein